MKAAVPLLLLMLVLAACGSHDRAPLTAQGRPTETPSIPASQESAGPLDACALLTAADVAEVVGSEPRKPKPAKASQMPGSAIEGSACEYRGEGWRIRFFAERGHTELSKKAARPALKTWQPVKRLGDEAYWGQSDPAKPGAMTVFEGPHALVLTWFIRGETAGAGTLENSTELMRRALARL